MNPFPPVRKIGIQTRSVTGTMPDRNRYESSLERDLIELVHGHPDFESYHSQPVWIPYVDPETGQIKKYPPDGLIIWKTGVQRPVLVEVKYREDFAGQWRTVMPKFRAARKFAADKGWEFRVLTETHIRGPRLMNIRFLSAYARRRPAPDVEQALLAAIGSGAHTPSLAIARIAQSEQGTSAAAVIPYIWRLLATYRAHFDWDSPLTMSSSIWVES